MIEYLTQNNIITFAVVLLMLYFLKNLFSGRISSNKFGNALGFIGLGAGLYLWKSGQVLEVVQQMQNMLR